MSSTTPQLPRTKPIKTAKLRASCDACNEAKVRCSKDKPSCTRCVSHGTGCVYSPSQRAGKYRTTGKGGIQRPSMSGVESSHQRTPSSKSMTSARLDEWNLDIFGFHTGDDNDSTGFNTSSASDSLSPLAPNMPFFTGSPSPISQRSSLNEPQSLELLSMCRASAMLESDLTDPNLWWNNSETSRQQMEQNFYPTPSSGTPPDLMYRSEMPSVFATQPSSTPQWSTSGACACAETLSKQLLLLCTPDDNIGNTFDVDLAQSKDSTALCAQALACSCSIGNDVHLMLIASLIARNINVLEKALHSINSTGAPLPETKNEFHTSDPPRCSIFTPKSSLSTSPTSSCSQNFGNSPPSWSKSSFNLGANGHSSTNLALGAYELDAESLRPLKLEILRIELRKIKNLVAGFRSKFTSLAQDSANADKMDIVDPALVEDELAHLHSVSTMLERKISKAWEMVEKGEVDP